MLSEVKRLCSGHLGHSLVACATADGCVRTLACSQTLSENSSELTGLNAISTSFEDALVTLVQPDGRCITSLTWVELGVTCVRIIPCLFLWLLMRCLISPFSSGVNPALSTYGHQTIPLSNGVVRGSCTSAPRSSLSDLLPCIRYPELAMTAGTMP